MTYPSIQSITLSHSCWSPAGVISIFMKLGVVKFRNSPRKNTTTFSLKPEKRHSNRNPFVIWRGGVKHLLNASFHPPFVWQMISVETRFFFVNVPKSAHLSLSLCPKDLLWKERFLGVNNFTIKEWEERERDFNLRIQNQNPFNKMRKLWLFLLQKEMKEFYAILNKLKRKKLN